MRTNMADQITDKQRDGVLKLFLEPRLSEGVIYEPRGYFDVMTIPGGDASTIITGDGASFYNGEAYPIRLTHLAFAVQTLSADSRLIQRMQIRLRYHDAYYMSRFPALIPLWANVITATPDIVAPGVSTWKFPFPLTLGQRDTIQVRVQDVEDTFTPNVTREVQAPLPVHDTRAAQHRRQRCSHARRDGLPQ
jgi:hypothetical protein